MQVIYNNKKVKENEFLKINLVQNIPQIVFPNVNDTYTLVMYDPDALGGTFIHWIVTNIKNGDIIKGTQLVPYKPPTPPSKTGKHRYIFELYKQSILPSMSIQSRKDTIDSIRKQLQLNKPSFSIKFRSENATGGKTIKKRQKKSRKTKKKY